MICVNNVGVLLILLAAAFVVCDPASSKESKIARSGKPQRSKECQYTKGAWSECNQATNVKTRTLTLKKSEDDRKCEMTKIVEKKCKKACKYEKGPWSKCNAQNEMSRTDTLKNPNESDPSCEKSKIVSRQCKNKNDRPGKGQKRKHDQNRNKNNGKQQHH